VWEFTEVGDVFAYHYIDWEISMTRNSYFYIVNGVLPTMFVTVITLVALWLPDFNSRLHLCITGLLSVFAVQWTMSASLPVTEVITWLEIFSVTCVGTITFICVECCIISQLNTFTSDPPTWIKYITFYCVLNNVTDATTADRAHALKSLHVLRAQKMKSDTAVHSTENDDASTIHSIPECPSESSDSSDDEVTDFDTKSPAKVFVQPSDNTSSLDIEATCVKDFGMATRKRRWSTLHTMVKPAYRLYGKKSSVKDFEDLNQRIWKLFALTVDNALKVLLPMFFCIFLGIHFSKLL
jgi:hypothetical protein